MTARAGSSDRLDSWKDIATYLGRNVRTVMRWESGKGLPVRRVPGGQRKAVYAFKQEIDEWLRDEHQFLNETSDSLSAVSTETSTSLTNSGGSREESRVVTDPRSRVFAPRTWRRGVKTAWALVSILFLAIGASAVGLWNFSREPVFTGVRQITGDGAMKTGLVTDGQTLFFGEYQDGRIILSSVPISGGPIKRIPTPFRAVVPVDISPDRRTILAFVGEGAEEERSLWMISLSGLPPKQIGSIRCHDAAWSPDGQTIAIASRNGIYFTPDQGASLRLLQAFDSIPVSLRWSRDGEVIRAAVKDLSTLQFSFWDLHLSSAPNLHVSSLVPLQTGISDSLTGSMTLDDQGRTFAPNGNPWDQRILFLRKNRQLWSSHVVVSSLASPINAVNNMVFDRATNKVFAIGSSAVLGAENERRVDLIEFDSVSHEFRPFLSGIVAEFVDFSRDGQWIAYVRRSHEVWISRPDGSSARELNLPQGTFELPRWSPDGKYIAVMAELPNKPWRIYIANVAGEIFKEASTGTSAQGAPTWSPDGMTLSYGGVQCQEAGTCAVHEIDVATGHEITVPGSEGLGTARWSPDGRYIAALNPLKHEVQLFDFSKQQWRKLTDGVNGNDLSWSSDSRYLFASNPGGSQPEILRITIADNRIERVVDLSDFAKLKGRIDIWFGIAPDNSIIFARELESSEIYAISYSE